MIGYSETFRGDVAPWEVDATEHFTVAFYYEKFEYHDILHKKNIHVKNNLKQFFFFQ